MPVADQSKPGQSAKGCQSQSSRIAGSETTRRHCIGSNHFRGEGCPVSHAKREKRGIPRLESDCSRYNGGVSFLIRQFEKTDFDTLWRIDQACFDPQLAYSRPELAFYMRRPGSFSLVAEGDGGILGSVSYTHLTLPTNRE